MLTLLLILLVVVLLVAALSGPRYLRSRRTTVVEQPTVVERPRRTIVEEYD
jgi:hypothetical protein